MVRNKFRLNGDSPLPLTAQQIIYITQSNERS